MYKIHPSVSTYSQNIFIGFYGIYIMYESVLLLCEINSPVANKYFGYYQYSAIHFYSWTWLFWVLYLLSGFYLR